MNRLFKFYYYRLFMKPVIKSILFVIIVLVFVTAIIAVTTITDKRIDLDGGQLFSVANITIKSNPLMFIDESDGRIIAIFDNENSQTFNSRVLNGNNIIGLNGQTVLVGEVKNYDDINSPSRFSEININNGSSATAVFSAFNDIGFNITFGLGSSNFAIGAVQIPNAPILISFSPSDLRFVNRYANGFIWISSTDNNVSNVASLATMMSLSKDGSLNVTGNFTGERIQFRPQDPKEDCDIDTQGTIVYEANGTKGDFFGCTKLNPSSFSWKKLN